MAPRFDPSLVNDRFDDPGLYVDLVFEKRALLFDLGDLGPLPPRKLLRVSDVFVTHRHMDHFAGFDQLLRRLLGREKTVGLYGPPGTIEAVGHKLAAYSWNLIDAYDEALTFRVTEMAADGRLTAAFFRGRERFKRGETEAGRSLDGCLLSEPGARVRAATLDHGLPVLAFALEERAQINVWRNKVQAMGLAIGPWLGAFKEAMLQGAGEATPVAVEWAPGADGPATLPLGLLRKEIMKVAAGRKIAYVVDCAYTEDNCARIAELARGADILYIEGGFLEEDAAAAARRRHLTARQAGLIARRAEAKRLATFHYSPRYRGFGHRLEAEARDAYLNG
ncbi:ribonuclease Z [Methylocystis sp. JAN1]|uniref:ribonuclease Z n=1 Tax=Methylocystis sp. JAN1 TaxID=3397211 RepID=UPI003FA2844F